MNKHNVHTHMHKHNVKCSHRIKKNRSTKTKNVKTKNAQTQNVKCKM
jgi:hypothetical protein